MLLFIIDFGNKKPVRMTIIFYIIRIEELENIFSSRKFYMDPQNNILLASFCCYHIYININVVFPVS